MNAPGPLAPMSNEQLTEALGEIKKAYTTTGVTGLELVREDLQAQMAVMAPVDTPVRNRLRRIQGRKSVALLGYMRETPPTYAMAA